MPYASNKKIGGLDQVTTPLGDNDNVVIEQSGTAKRGTLAQLIAKVFTIGTNISPTTTSDSAVVVRSDGSVGKAALTALIPTGAVTNDSVSTAAGIVDTKLATISTAGKVLNSATTATSANTTGAIVARDGSGNFAAGTVTAALSGNATTATNLNKTGDAVTTGVVYQSGNTATSVLGNTASTGFVLTSTGTSTAPTWQQAPGGGTVTAANNLSGGIAGQIPYQSGPSTTVFTSGDSNSVLASQGANLAPVWVPMVTDASTGNSIVRRNASGGFTAGTVTAALAGNATTATTLATARQINGTSWLGPASTTDITITANTPNALTRGSYLTSTNATTTFNGSQVMTWNVDAQSSNTSGANKIVARDASGNFEAGTITATLTGNASTATKLNSSRTFALTGDVTGSVSSDLTSGASIGATIAANAVDSTKLKSDATADSNRAVTTNHIRDNAVTSTKLLSDASVDANRAVTTNHIKDAAVTTAKLATSAVTNAVLAPSAVNSQTAKTTPVAADEYLIWDSAASGLKKISHTNLAASLLPSGSILKTAFNSVASTSHTNAAISYPTNGPVSTSYASGVEVLSATITPTSTSNQIVAHAVISGIDSNGSNLFVTGFLVGGTTLLMSNVEDIQQTYQQVTGMSLLGRWSPNSTSQQTIRVYLGASAAGTHTTRTISLFVYEIKA